MARLFTAIELSDDARVRVVGAQEILARAAGSGDLRLVKAAQLHLTLVFIGEVDESRIAIITDALTPDIPLDPFEMTIASCGVFPPRGLARVLWLGLSTGGSEVGALYRVVATRLEQVGVRGEPRPFSPHLTIGRWREGHGGARRRALPDIGTVARQTVSAVTLFRSRLSPAGPEHTLLATARLAGSSAALH
jgi:2'-5' RNA ligase